MADSRVRTGTNVKLGSGKPANKADETEDQNGTGSLLEDDADDDDDDDEDENDDEDDDSDDDDKSGGKKGRSKELDVDSLVEKLGGRIDSAVDRRIGAVLREIRGSKKTADDNDDKPPAKKGSDKVTEHKPAPVAADVRGARIAYRDYVGDKIRFISNEESAFATDLANTKIKARAFAGFEDEDIVGQEVAAEVAAAITDLRKHYEDRDKRALKKKGLLSDQTDGQGPAMSRTDTAKVTASVKAGADRAAARHPRPGASGSGS